MARTRGKPIRERKPDSLIWASGGGKKAECLDSHKRKTNRKGARTEQGSHRITQTIFLTINVKPKMSNILGK